jgi:nucleoside-diphosphate-sugar epimerase
MTRSPGKQSQIAQLGATPAAVDALDSGAVERAVRAASPTHLVHQLTALPASGPRRAADLQETNRLREEGTRNLLRAAEAAGTRRMVVGSFAPFAASNLTVRDDEGIGRAVRAVQSMEEQVLAASRRGAIEGIVLRYGLFYGAGTPSTDQMIALVQKRRLPTLMNDRGRLPFIHLADAVTATVAALHSGTSKGVYHIVDDQPASMSEMVREIAALTGAPRPFVIPRWLFQLAQPYLARMLSMDLSLSNAEACRDLEWLPRFPSYREGLRNDLLARN